MKNCKFKNRYNADDATILANPELENGVVKIQSNYHLDMIDNEKMACSHL